MGSRSLSGRCHLTGTFACEEHGQRKGLNHRKSYRLTDIACSIAGAAIHTYMPAVDPFHCKQTALFISHHSQPGYVYGGGANRSKDVGGRGFRDGTIAEAVESSR